MSNVHQLYPGKNFTMRIDVMRGPQLVVRFDDGWEYPLDITREQAVYLAGLLLDAAIDGETDA